MGIGASQFGRDVLTRPDTKQKNFSARDLSSGGAHFRVLGFDHTFEIRIQNRISSRMEGP